MPHTMVSNFMNTRINHMNVHRILQSDGRWHITSIDNGVFDMTIKTLTIATGIALTLVASGSAAFAR